MSKIIFSRSAQQDRREITEFTANRFGVRQARRLRDRFEQTLRTLAASPELGRPDDKLSPPGRALLYFPVMNRFIIVYEQADEGIHVVRLLHGARQIASELAREIEPQSD